MKRTEAENRYYAKNREAILEKARAAWPERYAKTKYKRAEAQRNRRLANLEYAHAKDHQYEMARKEKKKQYNIEYKAKNKEILAEKRKEKAITDKEHIHEIQRNFYFRKKESDIRYVLSRRISANISTILRKKGGSKRGIHWEELVGYTIEDLIKHLEKQFVNGMSWENKGRYGWHIDHKIPISAFNFSSPTDLDFKRCWALKNLKPMWATDNIVKSNKLFKPFQPGLQIEIKPAPCEVKK